MGTFAEYTEYDAVGLSELIQQKQVSKTEVVHAAIDQIEEFNPQINAVVHTQFDAAKSNAESIEGPLSGVPF